MAARAFDAASRPTASCARPLAGPTGKMVVDLEVRRSACARWHATPGHTHVFARHSHGPPQKYASSEARVDAEFGLGDLGAQLPVDSALWAATHEFSRVGAKPTDGKRVWIFTNDDNPPVDATVAVARARDSWLNREELSVFPFQDPGHAAFDANRFWVRLLGTPVEEDDVLDDRSIGAGSAASTASDGTGWRSAASSSATAAPTVASRSAVAAASSVVFDTRGREVKKRIIKKRVYARIPFTLTPGVHITLGVYNLIYPARKPAGVNRLADGDAMCVGAIAAVMRACGRPPPRRTRLLPAA